MGFGPSGSTRDLGARLFLDRKCSRNRSHDQEAAGEKLPRPVGRIGCSDVDEMAGE